MSEITEDAWWDCYGGSLKAWLVSQTAQARFDGAEYRREFKSFFRRIQERRGGPKINFECVVCAEKPHA